MSTDTKPTATTPRRAASGSAEHNPIIIDMGKKKRKDIRKLRKGKGGKLMDRVAEALDHLKESGQLSATAQPVIIVVKERTRSRGGRAAKMFGLG
jgi:hypothetical protein